MTMRNETIACDCLVKADADQRVGRVRIEQEEADNLLRPYHEVYAAQVQSMQADIQNLCDKQKELRIVLTKLGQIKSWSIVNFLE